MHIICYPGNGVDLSIMDVHFSDSGTYICHPKNGIGNARNGTTKVTVRGMEGKKGWGEAIRKGVKEG